MNRPSQPTPFDDDATGMRNLLGSLPDPGPMPDALASRITAALEAERQQHATVTPLRQRPRPVMETSEDVDYDHQVASLWDAPSASKKRASSQPRRWQVIAGVAAGLVLVGSAGSLLVMRGNQSDELADGGAMSFPPSATASPAPSENTRGAIESPAESASPKGIGAIPPDTRGELGSEGNPAITASNRDYTTADVDALTAAIPPATKLNPGIGGAAGVGPLATPLGLAQCLNTLGVSKPSTITLDIARFQGKPAAILVTTSSAGKQARVITRTCGSDGSKPVLYGPVSLS